MAGKLVGCTVFLGVFFMDILCVLFMLNGRDKFASCAVPFTPQGWFTTSAPLDDKPPSSLFKSIVSDFLVDDSSPPPAGDAAVDCVYAAGYVLCLIITFTVSYAALVDLRRLRNAGQKGAKGASEAARQDDLTLMQTKIGSVGTVVCGQYAQAQARVKGVDRNNQTNMLRWEVELLAGGDEDSKEAGSVVLIPKENLFFNARANAPAFELGQEDGSVKLCVELDRDLLYCCVCTEPLVGQIYQCKRGAHNVCGPCESQIKKFSGNKCPMDRERGGFIRNILLERQVATISQPCRFSTRGCTQRLFPWITEEHEEACEMCWKTLDEYDCPACGMRLRRRQKFTEHLISGCQVHYAPLVPQVKGNKLKFVLTGNHYLVCQATNFPSTVLIFTRRETPGCSTSATEDCKTSPENVRWDVTHLPLKPLQRDRQEFLSWAQYQKDSDDTDREAEFSIADADRLVVHAVRFLMDATDEKTDTEEKQDDIDEWDTNTGIRPDMHYPIRGAFSPSPGQIASLHAMRGASSCGVVASLVSVSPRLHAGVGGFVDACDTVEKWHVAQIVKWQGEDVFIHYLGFSKRWDEWINVASDRLSPLGSHDSTHDHINGSQLLIVQESA